MPRSRIPSPSRSQGGITPRRYKPRGTRSVGSPARSNTSERLTSIIQFNEKNLDSFVLSPLPNRRSLLTDNTDIEEPRRKSWWKKLNESTTDVMELITTNNVVVRNNVVEEYIDVEVLSQEKKNYTLDLPESSDNESINSIVIPHRKLFTQKENQPQNKFGQLIENRESLAKLHKTNTNIDKSINVGPKNLFGQGSKQRNKIVFPAALLTISPNKTANKTKELAPAEVKGQVKSLFGNRAGTKRKNMFADFIVSESEDEIPEIQPRIFGFPKKSDQIPPRRSSSTSRGLRDPSPTSSITTDMEMDDWKLLPSSTMVENQLEDMLASGRTPVKKARLSKLSEAKESEAKSNSNITANKTKLSNKSMPLENKSKHYENVNNTDTSNNDAEIQEQPKNNKSSPTKDTTNTELNKSVSSKYINKEIVDQSRNKSKNTTKNKSRGKDNSGNLNISLTNKSFDKQVNTKKETLNLLVDEEKVVNKSLQSKTYQNQSQDFATKSIIPDDNQIISEYDNGNVNTDVVPNILEKRKTHNTSKTIVMNNSCESSLHKQNEPISQSINKTLTGLSKSIDKQNINSNSEKISNNIKTDASPIDELTAIQEYLNKQNNKSQDNINENNTINNNMKNKDVEIATEEVQDVLKEDEIEMDSQEDQAPNHHNKNIYKDFENSQSYNNVENQIQRAGNDQEEEIDNDGDNNTPLEDHNQEPCHEAENISQDINEDNQDLSEEVENDDNNVSEEEEDNPDASEEVEVDNQDVNEELEDDNADESTEVEDDNRDASEEIENDQEENEDDEEDVEQDKSQEVENETQDDSHEVDDDDDDQNEDYAVDEDEQETSHIENEEIENESQNENESEELEEENEAQEDQVLHYESDEEELDHDQDMPSEREDENEQLEHISETEEETANVTHTSTTRNKSIHAETEKSPEAIVFNKTNQMESFIEQGRNTTVRMTKSMIRPLNIKPSLAPLRESTGLSDGTRNSSAEGSGWDSHRTTRKTLRQTFGRDFTPRKSLRTLVMEKSAKRQTAIQDGITEDVHEGDVSESPEHVYDDDIVEEESTHEISKRTRQTTLEMYLQKIKKQNMEKKKKMEEAVRNSVKAPKRDILNQFKVPQRNFTLRRANTKPVQTKKPKPQKTHLIPLNDLPSELLEDMKYKPPKRFQPRNASWITMRLYKFLETKLEPKYDYKTRLRSEKLVETIYNFTREIRRHHVAPTDAVELLKQEMARLEVVKTHFEFYQFFHEFMPREIRVKVNPDVVNGIPTPRQGIFADILRSNTVQG